MHAVTCGDYRQDLPRKLSESEEPVREGKTLRSGKFVVSSVMHEEDEETKTNLVEELGLKSTSCNKNSKWLKVQSMTKTLSFLPLKTR